MGKKMKKSLVMLVAVLCFSLCMYADVNFVPVQSSTTVNNEYEQYVLAANTRVITVHYIKQVGGDAWSDATYSGTYNPDYGQYGEITIEGVTYTVHLNRAYGQDRDGRASYRYEAGGYYFNM